MKGLTVMIHNSTNYLLTAQFSQAPNENNVDDDIVGIVRFNGQTIDYNNSNTLFLERKAACAQNNHQTRKPINYSLNDPLTQFTNDRIVLLLESPSNAEYRSSRPCPAYGKTGDRINTQFIPLINRHLKICFPVLPIDGQAFDLVLLNSIRYQCDLGYAGNRTIINSVFSQLWNQTSHPFSDDLLERIKIISPVLVINACTQSNSGNKLCTSSFLKNNLTGTRVVEATNHPSRWNKNTILF